MNIFIKARPDQFDFSKSVSRVKKNFNLYRALKPKISEGNLFLWFDNFFATGNKKNKESLCIC